MNIINSGVSEDKIATSNKEKSRTPSGNVISVNIGDIRTIFSPEKFKISELSHLKLKVGQPSHQRLRNSCSSDRTLRSSCSTRVLITTKKQNSEKSRHNSTPHSMIKEVNEEGDNFYTPPATPVRATRSQRNTGVNATSKQTESITKYLSRPKAPQNMSSSPAAILCPGTNTEPNDEERMEITQQEDISTMNLTTIMQMFKRIEDRLQKIEQKDNQQPCREDAKKLTEIEATAKKDNEQTAEQVSSLKDEIKLLKRENFLLDRAAKMSIMTINNLSDRMAKLELNNSKKTIAISGLYIYGEKKEECVNEIEAFIEYELDLSVRVDDAYFVGNGNPRTVIAMLSTLQDKRKIMARKSYLKQVRNRDNKSIFINDYWPADTNEIRKMERELFIQNDEKDAQSKKNMEYKNGALHINGAAAQQLKPVQVPTPVQILDLDVEDLNTILRTPVNRGAEICKDNSRFIGYSTKIESYQQINDIYLKIKLTHPAAHHVICAYLFDSEMDDPFKNGYCDDGEHGAGKALLNHMLENSLNNRAIYVVRYYGGIKLGADRFTCIIRAANSVIDNSPPASPVRGTPPKREPSMTAPAQAIANQHQAHSKSSSPRVARRGANTPSKSSQRGMLSRPKQGVQHSTNQHTR